MIDEFKGMISIVVCGGIGIIIAMLIELFVDNGWIMDEYIVGSITLVDLKTVIVAAWLIVGIVVGVWRNR